MKKLLAILFIVVIATNAFSQQLCQSNYTYDYNPVGGTLNLYDNSYNLDSTQLNVTSWYWSVQYGGASYTYNIQNPTIQLNGYSGPIMVCLQISALLCQSVYCDTIYTNTNPSDSCVASYTYQTDSLGFVYNFFDASYTNNGSINYWSWVISDQNQNILATFNTQNPIFTFPGNGTYSVCLNIASDSGCQQTTCETIYIQDSNNNCQLNISSNIGHVSVTGGNDGFIELTVTGGTGAYSYLWSAGGTGIIPSGQSGNKDLTLLVAGTYTTVVTDANGCTATTSAVLTNINPNPVQPATINH